MFDFMNNDKLKGVSCDAVNCRYHGTDNYCHADEIEVGSPTAQHRGETYCGTFTSAAEI